jgi:hypothetical protein
MTTGRELIAASMSEGDLDAQVRKILKDLPGVLGYHTRYSAGSHAGFPDWTFAGPGGVLFAELKNQARKPTPAQEAWLDILAGGPPLLPAELWRPSDLVSGRIGRTLGRLARS